MADWSESVKVPLVADSKAILDVGAGGLALISFAGVIPLVGLVRAEDSGCRHILNLLLRY